MQNARQLIIHLLTKGKIEAAIEASLLLCRHYGDQERSADAAQHSARFHALMDDYHAGTLSDDDYRPERARINRAMLDLAHNIPADWTDEALMQQGFSAKAYDQDKAPREKSFSKKWIMILGILAIILTILGLTMKDVIFPTKETPGNTRSTETQSEDTKSNTQAEPDETTTQAPPSSIKNIPTTIPKVDGKFRSFSNQKIVNYMERGYMDGKFAFRNVRTKEILCCYAKAEDFSGNRAYVSKDGQKFFYIDTKGNVVQ